MASCRSMSLNAVAAPSLGYSSAHTNRISKKSATQMLRPCSVSLSVSRKCESGFFTGSSQIACYVQQQQLQNVQKRAVMSRVVCQAKSEETEDLGAIVYGAVGGGLVAIPVVVWSLYTLKTTGCGLPPGPAGSVGALEGVSYLLVLAIIGWSVYSKIKTGSGLPTGPFGLLGAVEGLCYLSLLAILVVFGLQALDYGYIPGPVPGEKCFG